MKKGLTIGLTGLIILVIGAIVYAVATQQADSGEYNEFTQCVADSGATFYGAFWCPHCLEQKRLFGSSNRALPYVECSTPDQQSQTQECIDANVQSYPTWEFGDGSRETGSLPLSLIAERTNCALPVTE